MWRGGLLYVGWLSLLRTARPESKDLTPSIRVETSRNRRPYQEKRCRGGHNTIAMADFLRLGIRKCQA